MKAKFPSLFVTANGLFIGALVGLLTLFGVLTVNNSFVFFPREQLQLQEIKLSDQVLNVEVVTTPESQAQGLSDREQIGADGMLFIFPAKTVPRFWMNKMKFDIDMIWLADGQVVDITSHVPAPAADGSDLPLPIYSPAVPADMVLEVEAGQAEIWGLEVGDQLML